MVDRIDLDTQISSTFHAADAPNLEKADSRADLERLLAQDARKIIITTIFKFGEVGGVLNDRHNIIVLVDEAHRSQEGDLGRKMRRALPNAFLFGLTGTPINRADRNTFFAFGAEEDEYGYLSRYGFEESIRDGFDAPILQAMYLDKPLRDHTADDPCRRARGEEGASEDAVQVPPAPGQGTVRPGLRVHPAVLLTLHHGNPVSRPGSPTGPLRLARVGEGMMTTRQDGLLADWYSRVVFGVIAASLATLAVQGACTVQPVARAQGSACGDRFDPCYVEVLDVAGTVAVAEPVNVIVLNR